MIELDEFELSEKHMVHMVGWFGVVCELWIWAYLTVFLLAVYVISPGNWIFTPIFFAVLMAFSLLTFYFIWRYCDYSCLPKLKMAFGEGMYRMVSDGSEVQKPLSDIVKADISNDSYRLFMNKMVYYPIPITAFRSEEDRIRFETEILGDKLKRFSIPWKTVIIFLLVSACVLGLALMLRLSRDSLEAERELDKLPQIIDNNGHGSDTCNNEFRPAGTDYGITPGTPQSGSRSDRPAESGGI